MIGTLVLFGATGDLAGRLLLPAVAALHASGDLTDVRVVGAGSEDMTSDEFADHVRRKLETHAPSVPRRAREAVADHAGYRQVDVTDPAGVAAVLDAIGDGPVAVYLALPTGLLPDAVRALRDRGLPAGSRLAIEKPFGQDADGAAELNAVLREIDATPQQRSVYRVDHTLAVAGVQRLAESVPPDVLGLEVLFEETLALEGRAAFYDRAGALRDVMQNHQVQLLCTVAGATDSGSREELLRAVRPADVARSRRARYTAGTLAARDGGRRVPDYADEDGVDASRRTETFAEVVLDLDIPRWRGTPIVLRAGKALAERRRGVLVRRSGGDPVWLDIDAPDAGDRPEDEPEPVAYRRIVADLLGGGSSFCVSADEAELAWRIFMPVLRGWAADAVPLQTYAAGSSGPDERLTSRT